MATYNVQSIEIFSGSTPIPEILTAEYIDNDEIRNTIIVHPQENVTIEEDFVATCVVTYQTNGKDCGTKSFNVDVTASTSDCSGVNAYTTVNGVKTENTVWTSSQEDDRIITLETSESSRCKAIVNGATCSNTQFWVTPETNTNKVLVKPPKGEVSTLQEGVITITYSVDGVQRTTPLSFHLTKYATTVDCSTARANVNPSSCEWPTGDITHSSFTLESTNDSCPVVVTSVTFTPNNQTVFSESHNQNVVTITPTENDAEVSMVINYEIDSRRLSTDSISLIKHGSSPTPPSPYEQQYLTLVAKQNGQFKFKISDVNTNYEYSINDGNWITANKSTIIDASSGDKIRFKGELNTDNTGAVGIGIGTFETSASFNVEGNAMSLLFGDNFIGQTSIELKVYAFYELFKDCIYLESIENLVLPATTISHSCYRCMFLRCKALTTVPINLLPAKIMRGHCYDAMFKDCTLLGNVPNLPVETLYEYCYHEMFENCTSLVSVPSDLLSATELRQQCYGIMFRGCTSLTTAPELPATTLAESCYYSMFYNCTSLTTAPELPATTLATSCYQNMFRVCKGLTKSPILTAETLIESCYESMFAYCNSLSEITCLATDISATNCTKDWVYGVAASGTFTKAASMSSWTEGADGIPSGWNRINS